VGFQHKIRNPIFNTIFMTKKYFYFLVTVILILFGCKWNEGDAYYFNGSIKMINDTDSVRHLKADSIEMDDIFAGIPYVYDSLIVFISRKYPGCFAYVFSLNNGHKLGEFCRKGNGPNEYIGIQPYNVQFVVEDNEIKIWLNAYNNFRLLLLNLTASIRENRSVIDAELPFGASNAPHNEFFLNIFCLKDKILAKEQEFWIDNNNYIPAQYYVFNKNDKTLQDSFLVYKHPILTERDAFMPEDYFNSDDAIKPDNSKIAMAMFCLKQINILNIETGQIQGIRVKGSKDFDYLTSAANPLIKNFGSLCVDDHFIYVLYEGKTVKEGKRFIFSGSDVVYVFDWDGNLINKLSLDRKAYTIKINELTKCLYIDNYDNEKIFFYDVSFLYH